MIEIRLTDEDALKYLETHNPDVVALANSLRTATAYIDALEAERASIQISGMFDKPEVSSRVLNDSEKAKDLAPKFITQKTELKKSSHKRWTQEDYDIITWTLEQPIKNASRKLENLVKKFEGRTQEAVRTKLHEFGISVVNGVVQNKA